MKNFTLTIVLLLGIIIPACTKHQSEPLTQWNALSLTESPDSDYLSHMNLPHINLTFPGKMMSGSLDFKNGKWELNGFNYVLVSHNWTSGKLLLQLIKNGNIEKEYVIDPSVPFNTSIEVTSGEYSFKAYVMDHRGTTSLNIHLLHGSINKLMVE